MRLVVQKYGGSSVGSLEHIQRVAAHVEATVRRGNRVLVTISAMGDQTDDLLAMAMKLSAKPPRRELDMLLSAGERISAALLSIALAERKIQAQSLTGSQCGILTDETHGNARIHKILGDRIRDGLSHDKVIIVAGFQGMSAKTKEITTLGRGGSDLSAIALAASLGANVCELYKDVDGVMTADPRIVKNARILKNLTFGAMTELAWNGANVLHARGAHIASKFGIPFEIRTSLDFDKGGTLIKGYPGASMESPKVTAIAHKSGMCLVECRIKSPKGKAAPLAPALSWLWQQGESPVVSSQHFDPKSGYWLVMALKSELVDDFLAMVKDTVGDVETARRESGVATITVVGEGFQQSPETIEKACSVLDGTPLFMETRNTALTLCLPETALKTTLAALHRELIDLSPA